jgi:dTDP-4-dehydrorhamnose 3,5-epimerase
MIEGLVETPLKRISIAGGDVMHGLKAQDEHYRGFGEAYFSWVNPETVKAWKLHSRMTMNLLVPFGKVRFVFIELVRGSVVNFIEIEIGEANYSRITVPPGVWFGFQGRDEKPSLVLNLSNIEHDPSETDVKPLESFQFDWTG